MEIILKDQKYKILKTKLINYNALRDLWAHCVLTTYQKRWRVPLVEDQWH